MMPEDSLQPAGPASTEQAEVASAPAQTPAETETPGAATEPATLAPVATENADGDQGEVSQEHAASEELDEQGEAEDGAEEGLTPEQLEELKANEVAFSWQASEYVHHHKGMGWYMALLGILVVLTGVLIWLHYWLEILAVLAMGGAILVYARKPPRVLMYELTPKGITIEGKAYAFSEFRSFGVLPDEEWHTIDLEPVKRLSPRLALLFDPEDFDSIVGHLELHLPRVDRQPDVIELASRYLRF